MLIRDPKRSDFHDMVEVFFSYFPEAEADPSFGLLLYRKRPSIKDERRWFSGVLKGIRSGDVVMKVAEVDSHVVGWCDVRRVAPGTPTDHWGVLGLGIRREFRGRGIGAALMRDTLEGCRGGFEFVELAVHVNNARAIRLYEGFGFKKVGVRPNKIKRGGVYTDDQLMYLDLRPRGRTPSS